MTRMSKYTTVYVKSGVLRALQLKKLTLRMFVLLIFLSLTKTVIFLINTLIFLFIYDSLHFYITYILLR